jgi:hypothetical protein
MVPGRSQHIGKTNIPIDTTERKHNVKALIMKHTQAQIQYIPAKDMHFWIHLSSSFGRQWVDFHSGVVVYPKLVSERQTQSSTATSDIEDLMVRIKMQLSDDDSLGWIELLPRDAILSEVASYVICLISNVIFH